MPEGEGLMQGAGRGLLAAATATAAAFIANLYYAQPLVPYIAADLRIAPGLAGSIVSAGQFGYGIGLFLVVPLADSIENRRLVLSCSAVVIAALIGLATAPGAPAFFFWGALAGISSCGAQILIPYLSRILPAATRGRVLGYVSAGVLTTVMLARPLALFVTAAAGWRAIYWAAAAVALLLALWLARAMPPHRPTARLAYRETLRSMFAVYAANRRVRRRTVYQALIFAGFTMFWAVAPILLSARFGLAPAEIGLFALVGAGGAVTAPFAGRIADSGRGQGGMLIATLLIAAAFALSAVASERMLLAPLALAAILIDGAVQACQTFSRLIVLEVDPSIRGRVNALYMTLVYTSGAIGSIVGVYLYTRAGWAAVAALGITFALAVAAAVAIERPRDRGWDR